MPHCTTGAAPEETRAVAYQAVCTPQDRHGQTMVRGGHTWPCKHIMSVCGTRRNCVNSKLFHPFVQSFKKVIISVQIKDKNTRRAGGRSH